MVRCSPLVAAQVAIALAASGTALAAPPAEGAILIWSATGEPAGRIAGWALDGETRLLGHGPLAGTLIVWGDGDRLATVARAHGAVALRAPGSLCKGSPR